MRIIKKHIGRPVDFHSATVGHQPINGVIEAVSKGIAAIRYHTIRDGEGNLVAHDNDGYRTYLPVADARIIEVY